MADNTLTVWCVCTWDKYHSGYVYALKEMVEKNLTVPHQFKCITTRQLDGVFTVLPAVPWYGWWSKLSLFYPGIATGPSLYFDLDVVITGNIDYLVDYTKHKFAAPSNWAQSGHGGIQSSVMAWSGNFNEPYQSINWPEDSKRFWGDQEYLYDLLGENWERIPGVGSYKYHCRGGKPENLRVLAFHGKPDPHEVRDPWILPYTQTLRFHINGNMPNTSEQDSAATG